MTRCALECVIEGRPQPWARPRASANGGFHTAEAPRRWRAKAVQLMRLMWGKRAPLVGAVRVEVTATWARPKSRTPRDAGGTLSLAGQRDWALQTNRDGVYGEMPAHGTRADIDNVAKIVLDALEKAGVLANDHIVTDLVVRKRWTAVGSGRESVRVSVLRAVTP